jgi:quercetin dioxygenase-like cupin family protein
MEIAARTAWHRHSGGQTLHVTEGRPTSGTGTAPRRTTS